ncbi:type 4a pilus biogenesis protein PilO [Novipirellula caenicola]|uniref:Pilus assembly protein, PilO n=1 Tax=Novipirellula caenicola TaxID=1536901 RepID=A0ABP9VR57_9BACT
MSEIFTTKRSYNLMLHGGGIAGVVVILILMLFARHELQATRIQNDAAQSESLALMDKRNDIHETHRDTEQRVQSTENRVSQFKTKIPTKAGEIDFLSELSELAKASQFQIRDFRPGAVVNKPLHSEMDIRFVGEGQYAGLCRFLDGLQQLPRSYRIARLSVTAPKSSEQTFSAECQLRLLFDLDPELTTSGKRK